MNDLPPDIIAKAVFGGLSNLATHDAAATAWAAWAWLQDTDAGIPHVSFAVEGARSDAKFWSEHASPVELETYLLASAMQLADQGSMFHGKQIKRLVAALWGSMSPPEQDAFLAYAQGKKNR